MVIVDLGVADRVSVITHIAEENEERCGEIDRM